MMTAEELNEDIEVDESEWYGKCSCGGELCWTKASDVDFGYFSIDIEAEYCEKCGNWQIL